jgi:hypothetical protein
MARNVAAQSPYHASWAPSPAAPVVSPTPAAGSTPSDVAATPPNPNAPAVQPAPEAKPRAVGPVSREYARCDLCGEALGSHAGHFHMVSPLTARHVSVCRTCRRAALSEGYRPRA